MTPRLKWALAAGCTTVALSWVALVPTWRGSSDAAPAQEAPKAAPVAPAAPSQQPSAATPPSAAPAWATAQTPEQSAELRASTQQALTSDNAGDRIEAVRAVRDRHAVELLPDLLALVPSRDPELAPTLISACADLANQAEAAPAQRTAAASRLATWLQTESQREGADARGNQSVLIEALGRLNTPESVTALGGALESDKLPVHVATLAAEGLAKLGDPSARPAVERFRARLAAQPAADSFSQELRSEALATADRALATLH
ncbi:MAG TPA: hypothetical protein VFG30_06230 [Polyangiales bacterium]|nr:hypothetical protein [Polyangiales bacterium]